MAFVGLDPTFGYGGATLLSVPASTATTSYFGNLTSLAVEGDGKIVGVGSLNSSTSTGGSFSSTSDILVERLNADGSLDTSFGSGGTTIVPLKSGTTALDGNAVGVVIQADGKIVVLGGTNTRNSTGNASTISDFAVARLNASGSLDTSYGNGGYRLIDFTPTGVTTAQESTPTSLALGPDGKVVVAGNTQTQTSTTPGPVVPGSQDMAVARLNTDGSLDTSFGTGGKAVVAFDIGGSKTDTANAVLVQPDNKVVLAGSAEVAKVTVNNNQVSSTDFAIARLKADGTLDTSFAGTGKTTIPFDLGGDKNDVANAVALSGTKIVAAGTSTVSNAANGGFGSSTVQNLSVVQLNPDGSLDMSFAGTGKYHLALSQGGTSFGTTANGLLVEPDKSLLVAGNASQVNGGNSAGLLVKILPNGNLDNSFGNGGAALLASTFLTGNIAQQSDGKVVFLTSGGIGRTTAPAPQVVTAEYTVTGTGKRARINGIVLHFNTALNPNLAGLGTTYRVRFGSKSRRFLPIKSVTYDPKAYTVTIKLKQPTPNRGGLQVVVAAGGIAGADSQLLNNGQDLIVPVTVAAAKLNRH